MILKNHREVATKVAKGKLTLDRDTRVWTKQALSNPRISLLEISPDIAVTAGELGVEGLHGDPADRLIVATAIHYKAELVTKDKQIRSFSRIRTIW